MGHALRACGRDILFSACNWGSDDVWSWIRSAGAHMYRSTGDINDSPNSFSDIAKSQFAKFCFSGPQCFNDIDMLTVGMYGKGNVGHHAGELSKEEKAVWFKRYQNQFSLWCILSAPLMLGSDIRKMDKDILKLVTNKTLLKINQDPESRPPFQVNNWLPNGEACALAKLLADGTIAIGMFNFCDHPHGITVMNETLGFPFAAGYDLEYKDVFSNRKEIATQEKYFQLVEPYACRMFIVTPKKRKA